MKARTKVVNATGSDVILKLSTGGVISKLSNDPLRDGNHYYISIDLTSTYREYWCAVQPSAIPISGQDNVILSSDDCAEFSEVKLITKTVPNGAGRSVSRYTWEGTKSRDSKNNRAQPEPSRASPPPTSIPSPRGPQVTPSIWAPLNVGGAPSGSGAARRSKSKCTIL